jgi:hypothetical protein
VIGTLSPNVCTDRVLGRSSPSRLPSGGAPIRPRARSARPMAMSTRIQRPRRPTRVAGITPGTLPRGSDSVAGSRLVGATVRRIGAGRDLDGEDAARPGPALDGD